MCKELESTRVARPSARVGKPSIASITEQDKRSAVAMQRTDQLIPVSTGRTDHLKQRRIFHSFSQRQNHPSHFELLGTVVVERFLKTVFNLDRSLKLLQLRHNLKIVHSRMVKLLRQFARKISKLLLSDFTLFGPSKPLHDVDRAPESARGLPGNAKDCRNRSWVHQSIPFLVCGAPTLTAPHGRGKEHVLG